LLTAWEYIWETLAGVDVESEGLPLMLKMAPTVRVAVELTTTLSMLTTMRLVAVVVKVMLLKVTRTFPLPSVLKTQASAKRVEEQLLLREYWRLLLSLMVRMREEGLFWALKGVTSKTNRLAGEVLRVCRID
jgi:hypothetical protein